MNIVYPRFVSANVDALREVIERDPHMTNPVILKVALVIGMKIFYEAVQALDTKQINVQKNNRFCKEILKNPKRGRSN